MREKLYLIKIKKIVITRYKLKTVEDLDESQIDDFYKMIGANVKKMRNKRGMTQLQLSQALGHKSVGLVSQSELYIKKQHFNLKHLYQLAYILDCNIEDFLIFEKNQRNADELKALEESFKSK